MNQEWIYTLILIQKCVLWFNYSSKGTSPEKEHNALVFALFLHKKTSKVCLLINGFCVIYLYLHCLSHYAAMADLGKQRGEIWVQEGITPHPKSAAVAETAFDPREMGCEI